MNETPWKPIVNSLAEIKHIYAIKDGKCFVVVATRTPVTGHNLVPIMKGTSCEVPIVGEEESDEEEAKEKVQKWIDNN